MEHAVEVTFRGVEPSDPVERSVREHAERLERFGRVTSCRVVVEARHRHQRHGQLYHVRIELMAPGGEIVVTHDPEQDHSHEDVYVAIRDAFDAARRRLEDQVRAVRGDVKHQAAS
jgi:ribosome-associated translation inhibitor RaiA